MRVSSPPISKGKRVLIRVDFNEPLQRGKFQDSFRIRRTLPTIRALLKKGACLILLAHLEDPHSGRQLSFEGVLNSLAEVLGRRPFLVKNYSAHAIECAPSKLILLENVRFKKGEESNNEKFSRHLASLADIYINEAFSVSHRVHASVVGVTRFLPSYPGPLFQYEVEKLSEVLRPPHPFLLIVGGAKFKTKFALLKGFLPKADAIFLGGTLANTFLRARGIKVGRSIYEKEALSSIRRHFNSSKKIILPFDVWCGGKSSPRSVFNITQGDVIRDVGSETIDMLIDIAKLAKLVVWNGPLGYIEKGYSKGTESFLRGLSRLDTKVILGGGDTVSVVDRLGFTRKFYHVSTGGGAMLEFLATGTLPGIEALRKAKQLRRQ